jgi:hypothetical protein
MVVAAAGGIGGIFGTVDGALAAWFGVQVTSLEAYQKQLSSMLQDVEAQLTKVNTTDGLGSFGDFSEATALYNSYEATKQSIITQFQEISQLIDAMVTAIGKNANNYSEAESQIESQFNTILASYGSAPLPTPTVTPVATPNSTSSSSSTLMGNM